MEIYGGGGAPSPPPVFAPASSLQKCIFNFVFFVLLCFQARAAINPLPLVSGYKRKPL